MGFDFGSATGLNSVGDSISNATGIRSVGDALNLGTNYLTGGVAGYRNGGFGFSQPLDESVGEFSGRNAARKQIFMQQDAIANEVARRAKQLQDQQTMKQQNDLQASSAAGAIRASAAAQENQQFLGQPNPGKDFLGL